jgi:hypothetical protein
VTFWARTVIEANSFARARVRMQVKSRIVLKQGTGRRNMYISKNSGVVLLSRRIVRVNVNQISHRCP